MLDPIEMNNYYPFGMIKEGMFANSGEEYRYGFNGMERDNETKDFGNDLSTFFRGYDPRLARWKSVDPVVHHWESPYAAFANNPILLVDPRGDAINVTIDETGTKEGQKQYKHIYSIERKYCSLEQEDVWTGKVWHDGKWVTEKVYKKNIDEMIEHYFDEDFQLEEYGFDSFNHSDYFLTSFSISGQKRWGDDWLKEDNTFYIGNGYVEDNTQEIAGLILLARSAISYSLKKLSSNLIKPYQNKLKMRTVRRLGKEGMEKSGTTQTYTRIRSISGTAKYRIPDNLDDDLMTLIEVKNVKSLSYTNQLRDFNLYCQEEGYKFILRTRTDTQLTKPLLKLIEEGEIIHETF